MLVGGVGHRSQADSLRARVPKERKMADIPVEYEDVLQNIESGIFKSKSVSVTRWNKKNGRLGYLTFAGQFLG